MTQNTILPKEAKVMVAQVYQEDGWYGTRSRVILSATETEGFKTTKDAKPYKAMLARYVNEKFKLKDSLKTNELSFYALGSYVQYTYCGAGPSLYYNHLYLTVQDLLDWSEKNPKLRIKDMDSYERRQYRLSKKTAKNFGF